MAEALFQGQGAIVIRCHDLERQYRFYADMGLETNKHGPTYRQFHLGNGAKLDLTVIDAAAPPRRVAARKELAHLNPIIRVSDAREALRRALAAGGAEVELVVIDDERGRDHVLAYVNDPEGNLIGLGQLPG